jgi:phenylacetate-CoA ligase
MKLHIKNRIKAFPGFRYLTHMVPEVLLPGQSQFQRTIKMIGKTEFLSKNDLQLYQFNKLKQIIDYAWNKVPGYRQHWIENSFEPKKLRNFEDIKSIPFVTKELLRDNYKAFSNLDEQKANYVTTGGSTGIPFGFFRDRKNDHIESGFTYSIWRMQYPELKRKDNCTILRGIRLKGIYAVDYLNDLWLSSYDIDLKSTQKYIELIDKYRTPFMQAYPSALYQVAKIIKDNKLTLSHKFLFISLASEPLYDFQEEIIREVFATNICTHYGATERVVVAANCERNSRFHIYPQYGITEILDQKGKDVPQGESGEIVGTGFWNLSTPFIRYRTLDFAKRGKEYCDACKRNYQLLDKIDGRLQEFIVSKTSKLVSMTAINMHDDIFDNLKQFRFKQEERGKVVFQYVPKDKFTDESRRKILKGLEDKLQDNFDLTLHQVDSIPLTSSGKLRFLDQALDIKKVIHQL